jgi:dynein heavy chain
MERAEKLIGGLGGEQENWKTSSNNLDFRLKQLPGDVLLSASIITYLGPMKNEQRTVSLFE